ncbi:hypothetical protein [Paenibacillus sp. MMS18-CY102]|uniref:hypothetical protein n=1 Tax=Paenibacillus sp. MMS18-CY102 TaxID=2682849 RepID=UPI0013658817|nr:hypothetical protein [Paenibacillus sp. MMS18-CY102]MWC30549.1 hypothetical protein [Paenibacillus sp. MMS18-CY102]
MEIWHPSEGINEAVIEACIKKVCFDYLEIMPAIISRIDPISMEEAIQAYSEEMDRWTV